MEKICNCCKKSLNINEFSLVSSNKDGHSNKCFDCSRAYSLAYRLKVSGKVEKTEFKLSEKARGKR